VNPRTGQKARYPVLHLKGVVLASDVKARNAVACARLDVTPVAGDASRPGTIMCAGLTANGDINAHGFNTSGTIVTGSLTATVGINAPRVNSDGYVAARGGMIATGTLEVVPASGDPSRPGRITCVELATSGQKKFEIAHPLDPAHKTLSHASLEGPEAGVYYRGEAQLRDGRAVVALPPYFEALTRKEGRTVMITPRCEGDDPISPLAATGITDGRFLVRAIDRQNLSQRFYWEVKAVRGDIAELEVEQLTHAHATTVNPLNAVIP
jgi:hypothetical protein